MVYQRAGSILHQHENRPDAGIHEIAKHKIDDTVSTRVGQCGFGTLGCQRVQPDSVATSQDDGEYFPGSS